MRRGGGSKVGKPGWGAEQRGSHGTLTGQPVSLEAEEVRVEGAAVAVVVVVVMMTEAVLVQNKARSVQEQGGVGGGVGMMSPSWPEQSHDDNSLAQHSVAPNLAPPASSWAEAGLPPSIHKAGCNTFRRLIYIQINTARRNNVRLKKGTGSPFFSAGAIDIGRLDQAAALR